MADKKKSLFELLKKNFCSLDDIVSELDVSKKGAKKLISELKDEGVSVVDRNGTYFIQKFAQVSASTYKAATLDDVVKIAIVSDTHGSSEATRYDLLEKFYQKCKEEGVTEVYHCGDITDGIGVYKGQENQLEEWGVDKQAAAVIAKYPKIKGITTYFITGNHDLKALNQTGVDVGNLIVQGTRVNGRSIKGRDDMVYLGQYYARIKFKHGASLDLVHPDGGIAYARSYKIQKYIDALEGGSKPSILALGHLHINGYFCYRNIHALMAGAFQDQNEFLRRKGIQPNKGGWIVEFKIGKDGSIEYFKPQWVAFYDSKGEKK
ncbi:metallophosphoesterase family protein [Candidatus Woesearchaeota archaeon]|nr:metallophosphoesterase family protein [Candidatus Woesearchaeota archaeon]